MSIALSAQMLINIRQLKNSRELNPANS